MTIYLRQSTASQEVPLGYFVDSTDGNTEETALTIANTDIKVWKTGATTLANKNSGGATHISNGIYYAVLDATDTDTIGPLVIFVHVSGALTVRLECMVLDEVVYDWWTGTNTPTTGGAITVTSGRVNADVTHIATSAVSASSAQLGVNVVNLGGSVVDATSGLINANVKQISTDATAADNAESFFDGTGYAGTNNVIPTVTNLTNAATNGDLTATMKASVNAEADTALADYDAPTHTELTAELATADDAVLAAIAALNNLSQANIRTAVGLASANLDTQIAALAAYVDTEVAAILAAVDTEVAAIKAKTDSLTFTVAGQVDANIQSINDTTIVGNGVSPKFGV